MPEYGRCKSTPQITGRCESNTSEPQPYIPYSGKFLRKKISWFRWKTSISRFKFCDLYMDSLRLCLEISHFWRGGWLPLSSSSTKSSGRPCLRFGSILYWQCQSDSRYFLIFPPPDCTFLEIDTLLLESLDIVRLFLDSIVYIATWAICSSDNFMYRPREGWSLELESGAKIAGTVDRLWSPCAWQAAFRIRKKPRLNRKYFNRAWLQATPVLQWILYKRKINEWVNFVDKLAPKLQKLREILPLYGSSSVVIVYCSQKWTWIEIDWKPFQRRKSTLDTASPFIPHTVLRYCIPLARCQPTFHFTRWSHALAESVSLLSAQSVVLCPSQPTRIWSKALPKVKASPNCSLHKGTIPSCPLPLCYLHLVAASCSY